ncbi:hypothetical protein [Tessaracoccus coleopterorum]|uniref:hypothetical protein n=1 Tax=Tessaracoccus coleopterorum TaxID=2714950 RepID=UPI001E5EC914|nr:hypothetical protein [Tessaracoccus coleopterorum]
MLAQVEEQSKQVVADLSAASEIPVEIEWRPSSRTAPPSNARCSRPTPMPP